MEEVKMIDRAFDCRSCAWDINNASKRRIERIAKERMKHVKCKDCVRLREAVK